MIRHAAAYSYHDEHVSTRLWDPAVYDTPRHHEYHDEHVPVFLCGPQIETPSAEKLIHQHRPRDAFVVIAFTMEDICNTSKGFGFLFGEANLDLSIGLFSFARYSDDVATSSSRFLRRCGMVLCHEVGHLFGIKHCVYASCVMNGSNHLEESESRPFALCPVDLRKLQLTLDQARVQGRDTPPIDLVARQRRLSEFFDSHGLRDDACFSRALVSSLTGEAEPEPPSELEAGDGRGDTRSAGVVE